MTVSGRVECGRSVGLPGRTARAEWTDHEHCAALQSAIGLQTLLAAYAIQSTPYFSLYILHTALPWPPLAVSMLRRTRIVYKQLSRKPYTPPRHGIRFSAERARSTNRTKHTVTVQLTRIASRNPDRPRLPRIFPKDSTISNILKINYLVNVSYSIATSWDANEKTYTACYSHC